MGGPVEERTVISGQVDEAGFPSGLAEGLRRILVTLRRNTTAQHVVLIDAEGSPIAEAGGGKEGLLRKVLPTLAREVAIARDLGTRWGEESLLSLHHCEGKDRQVYTAAAADLPYALVLLAWREGPSPSGVTWLFLRRALQELRTLLRSAGV